MNSTCRCGCGKPASDASEYYGADAAERSRHRARRQTRERAQDRSREQTRQQQRGLVDAAGLTGLSFEALIASINEHFGLTAALVAEALDRAAACDEIGYRARLAADTAALLTRIMTLEIAAASDANEATHMAAALDRAEARAAQADADAASLRLRRRLPAAED